MTGVVTLAPLLDRVRRGQNSTGLPLTVIQPMKEFLKSSHTVGARCDVDKKKCSGVALSDPPSHSQEEPARVVVRSQSERTLQVLLVESKKLRGHFLSSSSCRLAAPRSMKSRPPLDKGGLQGGFGKVKPTHPGAPRPLSLRATPPKEGISNGGKQP